MKRLLVADTAVTLVFAASGRSSHNEHLGPLPVLETAWPFLVGLGAGWLITRGLSGSHANLAVGRYSVWRGNRAGGYMVILGTTVGAGMLLRQLTSDGTATAFVVVATAFIAAGFALVRVPGWWRARRRRINQISTAEEPHRHPEPSNRL